MREDQLHHRIASLADELQAHHMAIADGHPSDEEGFVPQGGNMLDVLAEHYRTAFDKMQGGREQWIEGTLDLADVVAKLRDKYPAHQEFSRYLERYKLQSISANDRAALLGFHKLGREAARKLLEKSISSKWRNIWENRPRERYSETRITQPRPVSRRTLRERRIPTVMRDDYEPPPRLSIRLKGLTPEQVDPDFKGTDLEFGTKYGHVNLQTKQEIERHKQQEVMMAWFGTVAAFEKAGRAMLVALPNVDPAALAEWLSKPGKAEKLRAWCDSIQAAAEAISKIRPA